MISNKKFVNLIIRNSKDGFSIEKIFSNILKNDIDLNYKIFKPSLESRGFFSRLFIIVQCFLNSSKINHITGDINYITPFLVGKKILTVHDIVVLKNLTGIKRKIYRLIWFQLPFMFCDIITTVSHATKKELLKEFNLKNKKIIVIHNPLILPKNFSKVKKNNKYPNILVMGTKKNKNILNIIKALKTERVTLSIVGKLSKYQLLKLKENKIVYKNFINLRDQAIYQLYIKSDLLLFPSFYEGFGLPIIEAQSFGVPVITSMLSSMPEIAGNGAVFVDPHNFLDIRNKTKDLLNNTMKKEVIVSAGYENIKRFSMKAISEKYITLYNSI